MEQRKIVQQLKENIDAFSPPYNILTEYSDTCHIKEDCKNCRIHFSRNCAIDHECENCCIIDCEGVNIREKCKNCVAIGAQNLFINKGDAVVIGKYDISKMDEDIQMLMWRK